MKKLDIYTEAYQGSLKEDKDSRNKELNNLAKDLEDALDLLESEPRNAKSRIRSVIKVLLSSEFLRRD